ncbi:thioesterase superfamily protein [Oceaniovalibus guishaninsula JLT2003]|uniref:Thioesterase superfamily protein n=1 Tax=Oceaniovalibus guishaninsula JLT2003 TaxID=1231392 RepID=K2H9A8_9RHOB|nr:acyl-CoA thioesterase [Oceaniovalibus guishaninsula]EKE43177.1 thioesterase superfamily protein [Oceaniovalibus guishaninsula JLT2003]
MPYSRPFGIEFNHCDPAGIVFYPRYLEMVNHMAENFFADVVGHGYAQMIADGNGCPTVRLEVDFRAPSRLGERLTLTLRVTAVGRSSLDLTVAGRGPADDLRFRAAKRIVWIGPDKRAAPWPDRIRDRLTESIEEDDG